MLTTITLVLAAFRREVSPMHIKALLVGVVALSASIEHAAGDSKSSPLPRPPILNGSELISGVQSGGAGKLTLSQIASFIAGNLGQIGVIRSPVGSIVSDSFNVMGQSGPYTADQIYEWSIGPGSDAAPALDAVRGVAYIPPGSTVLTGTGVAGYVLNNAPISASVPSAVSLFGVGVANANNSSTWGIDTILSDNKGQVASAGVGRFLVNEFDFNVTSPGTSVAGLNIGGTSLSQPSSATGVTVGVGSGVHWNYGFGTVDGAATEFAVIGSQAKTAKAKSQTLHFNAYDAGGVKQFVELQSEADYLTLAAGQGTGHGNFQLLHGSYHAPSGEGYKVNFHTVVAADSGAKAYLGPDASFKTITVGNGTAAIGLSGKVQMVLATPASSSAACSPGQFEDDANYHYVCTAPNTWKRVALSAF